MKLGFCLFVCLFFGGVILHSSPRYVGFPEKEKSKSE